MEPSTCWISDITPNWKMCVWRQGSERRTRALFAESMPTVASALNR